MSIVGRQTRRFAKRQAYADKNTRQEPKPYARPAMLGKRDPTAFALLRSIVHEGNICDVSYANAQTLSRVRIKSIDIGARENSAPGKFPWMHLATGSSSKRRHRQRGQSRVQRRRVQRRRVRRRPRPVVAHHPHHGPRALRRALPRLRLVPYLVEDPRRRSVRPRHLEDRLPVPRRPAQPRVPMLHQRHEATRRAASNALSSIASTVDRVSSYANQAWQFAQSGMQGIQAAQQFAASLGIGQPGGGGQSAQQPVAPTGSAPAAADPQVPAQTAPASGTFVPPPSDAGSMATASAPSGSSADQLAALIQALQQRQIPALPQPAAPAPAPAPARTAGKRSGDRRAA